MRLEPLLCDDTTCIFTAAPTAALAYRKVSSRVLTWFFPLAVGNVTMINQQYGKAREYHASPKIWTAEVLKIGGKSVIRML